MSATLNAAAIAQFDSEVKQAYQEGGKLRGTVRERKGVVGATMRFPKLGSGVAKARGTASSDVVPVGYTHTNATATLTDWYASEYTDIFAQAKVNFDERRELAKAIAMTLARREDQIIIDAMNVSGVTQTVAVGTTGLTLAKITSSARLLNDNGVPMEDRHIAISAAALEDVMNDNKISNADYNTVRTLMSGEIKTFMGFTWHLIATRTEGGLVKSSNTRTCLAWHMDAVGLAVGIEPKTEVNYVAHKMSHLSTGMLSAGAVAIDVTGIVKVNIDETA